MIIIYILNFLVLSMKFHVATLNAMLLTLKQTVVVIHEIVPHEKR